MRIAIDARYLDDRPSGIGFYSESLLLALSRIDTRNEYIVFTRPGYTRPDELGANFELRPHAAPPLSFDSVFRFHRQVQETRADLFHAHCPVTPRRYAGPMLVTLHDLQPLEMDAWCGGPGRPWPLKKAYQAFYRRAYPSSFRRAAGIVCVSRATANALIRREPALAIKTHTIHSGPPPAAAFEPVAPAEGLAVREKYGLPADYLLYIGSTRANKNLPRMLEAFARLRAERPEHRPLGFVLVVSPDRSFPALRELCQRLDITLSVRFLQRLDQGDKRLLCHFARAMMLATMYEGFGFPLLEAQAQGCPVLAARHGALPEIAGENGAHFTNPEDSAAIARDLDRLLIDQPLRERIVRAGYENLRRFSWEHCAADLLQLYRETLA